MQTVSLYDELDFELAEEIQLRITNYELRETSELPTDDNNIIIKAVKALQETFNIQKGVKITLKKNIPLGAGLGGGSSDAAATINALVKLWDIKTEKDELNKIAARLGADVAFFLTGGTALCEGIGEIITQLRITNYESTTKPETHKLSLVLVNPGFGVPTPSVYKKVRLPFTNPQKIGKIKNLIESCHCEGQSPEAIQSSLKEDLFNRLEDFVLGDYPEIRKIKDVLISLGCASLMSGSGATVFGIYDKSKEQEIKTELEKYNWKFWFVETI